MLSSCGKYLRGLPHVRGGVSDEKRMPRRGRQSSPRAWGCFRGKTLGVSMNSVFPTCVGVFPRQEVFIGSRGRLPHVRGGVSLRPNAPDTLLSSSPRAWGCFSRTPSRCQRHAVFPTCVGVFRQATRRSGLPPSLPHVRGGVSIVLGYVIADIQSSPRAWGCFSMM